MTIAIRTRTVAALVGAAAVLATSAVPARAADPFTYTDARSDTLTGQAGADIRSVRYEVKAPRPGDHPHLVITMVLAAPPEPGMDYQTVSKGPCGGISTAYGPVAALTVAPGTGRSNVYFGCGGAVMDTTVVPDDVVGNTIRWSIAMHRLPAGLQEGRLSRLSAFTHYADPVTGHNGPGNVGVALDWARSSDDWSLS